MRLTVHMKRVIVKVQCLLLCVVLIFSLRKLPSPIVVNSFLVLHAHALYLAVTRDYVISTTVFAIWRLEYYNNWSCYKDWEMYRWFMSCEVHMTRKEQCQFGAYIQTLKDIFNCAFGALKLFLNQIHRSIFGSNIHRNCLTTEHPTSSDQTFSGYYQTILQLWICR